MRAYMSRFLDDRRGATAIEYALIAATVAVGITAAVGFIGQRLIAIFQQVQGAFPAA